MTSYDKLVMLFIIMVCLTVGLDNKKTIGVRRRVFKGAEDGRRPFQGWAARRTSKGRVWRVRVKFKGVHGHPLPYAHEKKPYLYLVCTNCHPVWAAVSFLHVGCQCDLKSVQFLTE
jgi:hypothetical protein